MPGCIIIPSANITHRYERYPEKTPAGSVYYVSKSYELPTATIN